MSRFELSAKSLHKLTWVHPGLVSVVEHAITICPIDFGISCGVRGVEQQRALVQAEASKTMESKHLIQADGFGHAVDLIAYIHDRISLEVPLYDYIATAMRASLFEVKLSEMLKIRWGGAWHIASIDDVDEDVETAAHEYIARKLEQHERPHMDAQHFELTSFDK